MTTDTYSTAGTFTWTAPAGVFSIQIECEGAGAGGNGASGSTGGGGGGGGAYAKTNTFAVTPGAQYTVVVGAAGTAGPAGGGAGSIATAGGDSSFNTNTCLAKGGGVGATVTAAGTGGAAASCVGDVTTSGGNGGSSGAASNGGAGGAGAAPLGGAGGAAQATNGVVGNPGTAPGGAGGGAKLNAAGGAGSDGRVVITYSVTSTGVNRSETLYPDNGTTTDTGTGIDVRRLNTTAPSSDTTQSLRWDHTQDNIERTFDPATALATNTINAGTTMAKLGYALRLADDMTPNDDANCNLFLPAGTVTVTLDTNLNMNGGTNLGGTAAMLHRASLWRYNPSTDSGTLIAAGSTSTSWNTGVGGDNNTYKTTTISISVASQVDFSQGEILMLQIGCQSGTLPNATIGTTNFDLTLRLGTGCKVAFAAGQHLQMLCKYAQLSFEEWFPTRQALTVRVSRTTYSEWYPAFSRFAQLFRLALALCEWSSTTKTLRLRLARLAESEWSQSKTIRVLSSRTAFSEWFGSRSVRVMASRTAYSEWAPSRVLRFLWSRTVFSEWYGSRVLRFRMTKSGQSEWFGSKTLRISLAPRVAFAEWVASKTLRLLKSSTTYSEWNSNYSRLLDLHRSDLALSEWAPNYIRSIIFVRKFTTYCEWFTQGRIELPIDRIPGDGTSPTTVIRPLFVFDD